MSGNIFWIKRQTIFLCFVLFVTGCISAKSDTRAVNIKSIRLAPVTRVTRKRPLLVNYFHMDYAESRVKCKEERLAQWDVIILNHDMVKAGRLSLKKIRTTNPKIKILVWIPFGQEPHPGMEISSGIPKDESGENWYLKMANGIYIKPHWGGHLMNPYKGGHAWAKYVVDFVKKNYLDSGLYDGVMFDVLSEWAPSFASTDNPKTADVDEDGDYDNDDNMLYREGVLDLVRSLRTGLPKAIITGNGGIPWSKECIYFNYANGNLHENALGNEFGEKTAAWKFAWDGLKACMNPPGVKKKFKRYHFIDVDIVHNRTVHEAKNLNYLTADDLRRMRLGLGTALLLDGYLGFDRGDCNHGQLWWFDEYDADLGIPFSGYKKDEYAIGTYSRKFKNGLAIVNPTSKSVKLAFTVIYKDVTTKKIGNNFILPAKDARIFIKE